MANNTLSRVYFLLGRNTKDDSQRAEDDPVGYFSCRESTARFLNIEGLATPGLIVKERQPGQRSKTLVDNTILTGQEESAEQIAFAPSQIILSLSAKGSKTAIITTGNKIENTKRKSNKESAKHTISFRFPGWATILTIADALATLIPEDKIKALPSQGQIFPYFKMKGGRKYPIMKRSAAVTNPTAKVGVTSADIQSLAQQSDAEIIEGAG